MKSTFKLAIATLCLLVTGVTLVYGQASSTMAELRGQVTDQTGAAIPNAKVTLTDSNKGTSRTIVTDAEGNYTFLALLPSAYELKIAASGFAPHATRLELTIGQQANVPVKLGAGNVEIQVEVVAGAEVVETDRAQQSSVIDAKQISSLPINRRNYLDYALLTPGVSDSDNIADQSDFRVAQTPQSGLSFGGNNGRLNAISVDGGETTSSTGGVLATVSQEAVQEFQVLRNSFNAEFGSASGGIVNIVSKSGGNRFHGSAFGLFRDDTFDARNAFDFNPNGQSPFNRQQYGGSLGGPIKKDKTFFFTAVERFDQEETTFVNLLNDPTIFNVSPAQNSLFTFLEEGTPFATAARGLRAALTTTATAYPRTVKLFTDASGQFPFDSNQTSFSARLDHTFSDRQSAYLRFNLNDSIFANQAAGALTAVSRGRTLDTFTGGALLSHNYQFSSTALNELKLQFSHTRFGVFPNDAIGPELNIQGFGNFGRDIFLPSKTIERHYDIYDNFTKVTGSHAIKFGGSMFFHDISTSNETYLGGRFDFGAAIPLSNIIALNPALGPTVLQQLTTFLSASNPGLLPALSAPINSLQSFNLNLPIVYQQSFGDPVADSWTNRYAVYAQDTWKVRPNFTLTYGLRYGVNDEPFFIRTDTNDVQPRVGFSWDPFKNGKTVIRGGGGLFAGYVIYSVPNVTTELSGMGDPSNLNIVIATATSNALGLPTSFTVYQTLLQRGILGVRPVTVADVSAAPIGITPGAGRPLEVRFRAADDYKTPMTYQSSLGIERDLGAGISLDVSYLFTRGIYLTRNRDINQFKATGPVTNGQPSFIRFPTAAQTAAGLTSDFRNPLRFQDNIYDSSANSFYHAMTVALTRRFANHFSLNAHYTFSKSIDEVTDFNSDFSAQNPLNVRLDRALSSFDQRHRAVLSGVFSSPMKSDSAAGRIFGGWLLSPIFIAGSGRPFNLLLGFDANNDGRSQSDRPGLAGRNTGLGEPYYSFDARLARRFFFGEERFLELTFEAFNLFNRTNLAGVNNIVGATPLTTFDARGDRSKAPTQPLGFTSAAAARQLQFGVRFNF
nr:TonB-dependent receptor [Nitrosomonas nitrosa]